VPRWTCFRSHRVRTQPFSTAPTRGNNARLTLRGKPIADYINSQRAQGISGNRGSARAQVYELRQSGSVPKYRDHRGPEVENKATPKKAPMTSF
jgi:hypothetical protein